MTKYFQIDLVNQIRTYFQKKIKFKKKLGHPNLSRSSRDVLRTSWRRPELFSQGRPMKFRLRRRLDVILGHPQDVRLGRPRDVRLRRLQDGQIGSLGDVLGTMEGDILETSWGPIFANWVLIMKIKIF